MKLNEISIVCCLELLILWKSQSYGKFNGHPLTSPNDESQSWYVDFMQGRFLGACSKTRLACVHLRHIGCLRRAKFRAEHDQLCKNHVPRGYCTETMWHKVVRMYKVVSIHSSSYQIIKRPYHIYIWMQCVDDYWVIVSRLGRSLPGFWSAGSTQHGTQLSSLEAFASPS